MADIPTDLVYTGDAEQLSTGDLTGTPIPVTTPTYNFRAPVVAGTVPEGGIMIDYGAANAGQYQLAVRVYTEAARTAGQERVTVTVQGEVLYDELLDTAAAGDIEDIVLNFISNGEPLMVQVDYQGVNTQTTGPIETQVAQDLID